jgi:hypothetical protein
VAETTVKRLLCCGFRRIGKAMGQVYQCWWRICREMKCFFFIFQVRISRVLRFIFICELFTVGTRGSVVVKALCYKPEGRGIASR